MSGESLKTSGNTFHRVLAPVWKPIETIPKGEPDEDGDWLGPVVLVWMPGEGYPWVARWVQSDGEAGHICSTYSESRAGKDEAWNVTLDGHPDPSRRPSHWKWPPDPPST